MNKIESASKVMIGDLIDVRTEANPDKPHYERLTPAHLLRDEIWYGIPLSEEFFKRNFSNLTLGVRWEAVRDVRENLGFVIEVDAILAHFRGIVGYVHQVQHVLRMCGIEMEITLPEE